LKQRASKINRLLLYYTRQFRRIRDRFRNKHKWFLQDQKKLEENKIDPKFGPFIPTKDDLMMLHYPYINDMEDHDKTYELILQENKSQVQSTEKNTKDYCKFKDCSMKALKPTEYCFAHIMLDPHQKLFNQCLYKSETGFICTYPVLKGKGSQYCCAHSHLDPSLNTPQQVTRKRKKEISEKEKAYKELLKTKTITSENALEYPVEFIYLRMAELIKTIQSKRRKTNELQKSMNNTNSHK